MLRALINKAALRALRGALRAAAQEYIKASDCDCAHKLGSPSPALAPVPALSTLRGPWPTPRPKPKPRSLQPQLESHKLMIG